MKLNTFIVFPYHLLPFWCTLPDFHSMTSQASSQSLTTTTPQLPQLTTAENYLGNILRIKLCINFFLSLVHFFDELFQDLLTSRWTGNICVACPRGWHPSASWRPILKPLGNIVLWDVQGVQGFLLVSNQEDKIIIAIAFLPIWKNPKIKFSNCNICVPFPLY